MAKTEDGAQFLKGTPPADEVGFLSGLSRPLRQNSKIKNPDRGLPSAQIIERIQRRANLLTDFRFRIDILKSVNQRGIFGTQFFSQFVHSLKQRIELLGISHLVGLLHLVTELGHLAIDSSLDLVAADDCEDLLRVRLGHPRWRRILSLRVCWRGGDQQDGNNQPQVPGMPPATWMFKPKKVTK
jgi:hypothetical protein